MLHVHGAASSKDTQLNITVQFLSLHTYYDPKVEPQLCAVSRICTASIPFHVFNDGP